MSDDLSGKPVGSGTGVWFLLDGVRFPDAVQASAWLDARKVEPGYVGGRLSVPPDGSGECWGLAIYLDRLPYRVDGRRPFWLKAEDYRKYGMVWGRSYYANA